MADIDKELHEMVQSFVEELEAAVSGSLYDVDGEFKIIDDLDEWKKEQYEKMAEEFRKKNPEDSYDHEVYDSYEEWMEEEIGTANDIDEPDEVFLHDYIHKQSLGDVRFEVYEDKTLCSGRVLFCYGGPTIWVSDDEVRGYWGSSTAEIPLDSPTSSALWDWFENKWDAVK